MKLTLAALVSATAFALIAGPSPKGPGSSALYSAMQITSSRTDVAESGSTFQEIERVQAISAGDAGDFQVAEDGTRFLLLKFKSAGATALRLHISAMRLSEGANLFVYGIRNGAATEVAGPYIGTGPSFDNDFWTDAVSGDEVVLEFQPGSSEPADLPFEVVELSRAEASDVAAAPQSTSETRTSMFRGMALQHDVVDGLAVFERDIILGEADELEAATSKSRSHTRQSLGITGSRYRWPGGVIPYTIDPLLPNQARITTAVNHWNTVMAGTIQMIPRTTEANYVNFAKAASAGTCSSSVGMMGYGRQSVQVGDYCSTGNVIHEIGHAVGLWHEQGREDRDTFVKILWENITSTSTYNFNQNISNGDDLGAYDYGSVMHYPAYGFSSNGQPTIQTIPAGIPIGQRSGLSAGDIAGVKSLYGGSTTAPAPAPTTPTAPATTDVTISTNPAGLPVTVDGRTYTSTVTLRWAVGTTHTLSAQVPAATTTRYAFQKWSNGGAQSQTVTASSTITMYKADYTVAYSVQTSSSPSGTATVSPASTDSFYAANTNLFLTATAAPGYCFAGWTGLLASTPASTSLVVTKPYSLQPSFLTGSITPQAARLGTVAKPSTVKIGINASTGCRWNATTQSSWATITSGSGVGSGIITVDVKQNSTGVARSATILVNGITVQLIQGSR